MAEFNYTAERNELRSIYTAAFRGVITTKTKLLIQDSPGISGTWGWNSKNRFFDYMDNIASTKNFGQFHLSIVRRAKNNTLVGREVSDKNENQGRSKAKYVGIGLALGSGFGAALGTAFGNVAIGVSLGTVFGIILGVALSGSGAWGRDV